MGNYEFTKTQYLIQPIQQDHISNLHYFKKKIIKCGKMIKESSNIYKFTFGDLELVLDIGRNIILHAGF